MLACGRSFRTRFDRETVGFDYPSAELLADVYAHGRQQTIRIVIRPGQTKKIEVNGVKKTAAELGETLNVVLFCPDDLNLIKEGAAVRRRLLDNAISQIRPKYAELLSEFNRLYEHKTRILKDWREKPSLLDGLERKALAARHARRVLRRALPHLGAADPLPRGLFGASRRGGRPHPPGVFRRRRGAVDPLLHRLHGHGSLRLRARDLLSDLRASGEAPPGRARGAAVSHRRAQGRPGDLHQRPQRALLRLAGADEDRGAVRQAGRAGDLSRRDGGIPHPAARRRALRAGRGPAGLRAQPPRRRADADLLLRGRGHLLPHRRQGARRGERQDPIDVPSPRQGHGRQRKGDRGHL